MPIGGVVFAEGLLEAKDADAGINALVEYRVVPGGGVDGRGGGGGGDVSDGYGTFHFASPHQSIVTLAKSLDYESVRRYTLTVVASVNDLITTTTTSYLLSLLNIASVLTASQFLL